METTVTILDDGSVIGTDLRANIVMDEPDGRWNGQIFGLTAVLITGNEYDLIAADGRRGRIMITRHEVAIPNIGSIILFDGVGPFARP